MGTLSPYEKMRLEKAKQGQKIGRPASPDVVRAVKSKVNWQAHKRALRVLAEVHKDEFAELRKAEAAFLRDLIDSLYEEGYVGREELLAEFYRRIQ